MDSAKCNVIYVDRNAHQDRVYETTSGSDSDSDVSENGELGNNIDLLVNAFGAGESHIGRWGVPNPLIRRNRH